MALLKKYYKPTPRKLRKLGDALLGISLSITTYSIYNEYKFFSIAAISCGVVGKFLTNFFADDE